MSNVEHPKHYQLSILTIKNDKIRDIVYLLLEDVLGATNFLEKYINEMENKQDEV